MNRIKILVSVSFLIFFLYACSHKKEKLKLIKKLENDIDFSTNTKSDDKKIADYIEACVNFNTKYANDTVCSDMLFNAGRLAMNLPQIEKANESLILFDKVIQQYPHTKDAPVALFMKAFYLENNVKDLTKAGEAYREFLAKYPKHQLSKDVKKCLDNLGKPLEQIVKEFEEQQKDTAKVKDRS